MKKLISKTKSTLSGSSSGPSTNTAQTPLHLPFQASTIQPVTPTDIYRYRYHHGTNLGSIFVLEKWLHGSMFPSSSTGTSELDAVTASVKEIGLEKTRAKWEKHWKNAVDDPTWTWFVNQAKGTSVRLPIGYFTLGPQWCKDTPFEAVSGVYVNAWAVVKAFVEKAHAFGVGVLLDLHALPGGANAEAHSGSSAGKADLWGNKKNCGLAKDILVFIAREMKGVQNVVGIQLCNEAIHGAKGMYDWYADVIAAIGLVDVTVPLYVSDAWELVHCADWTRRSGPGNPVIIDTHKYYTFSEQDRAQSPQQILGRIGSELSEVEGKSVDIVIGEWSCALDGRTWSFVQLGEKDGLVQQFGRAQSQRWQQKSGGSFFWTWKMDWMDGGEWGFVEQTKKGNILPPPWLTILAQEILKRAKNAQAQQKQLGVQVQRSHEEYWNKTSPGKQFQHAWYGEGWDLGFSDASVFFTARAEGKMDGKTRDGGDRIGCLESWVRKRVVESAKQGEFVWEFEQGVKAGYWAFHQCVGV